MEKLTSGKQAKRLYLTSTLKTRKIVVLDSLYEVWTNLDVISKNGSLERSSTSTLSATDWTTKSLLKR